INHRDGINSDESDNNKTKVYLTDRATNFNVPKSLDNPTNTIRGTITNIPANAGSVKNELSYTEQDLTTDMTTWSDNLAVTTHVDNEDLTDTSRPVTYNIKGQFITGIIHRYEPSVIINGVAYGGTYQESELASDRRREYGLTHRLENSYSAA